MLKHLALTSSLIGETMAPLEDNLPSCPYCGLNCIAGKGKCHCGCGRTTSIASKSRRGAKIGWPHRFIKGHNPSSSRIDVSNELPFNVDGDICRRIPLTRGQFAIVLDDHFAWLMQWRWHARWDPKVRGYYAVRNIKTEGKWTSVAMHRVINGLAYKDKEEVDHENHNTVDNRPRNLRNATHAENCRNRKTRIDSKTGVTGVYWHFNKTVATICVNGKTIVLGRFLTVDDAKPIRLEAEQRMFGEFANKHK